MLIGTILNVILAFMAYRYWKKGNKALYLVILQFLIFQDYKLSLMATSAIRPDDLALCLILATFAINVQKRLLTKNALSSIVKFFVLFVIAGMIVSLFVKGIPLDQVIRGGRTYLFVLALYDIVLMDKDTIKKALYYVFIVNMVFSVIFIMQTFVPLGLISDDWQGAGAERVGFLGLRRYYSAPPLVPFCCLYSVFLFPKCKKHKNAYICLSFLTLLIIQSRGMLMYTVMLVVLASLMFKASAAKKGLYIIMSVLMVVFVNTTVMSGETGAKTSNDFNLILSGKIDTSERPEGEATLAFRLWMLMGRNERIMDGSILDKVFGLGYFAQLPQAKIRDLDLQNLCVQYYEGDAYVINTPDISYANILAYLGYLGTFLYLAMFWKLIRYFYRNRKNSQFAQLGLLYMLFLLTTGMNGSAISTPTCLVVPFMFLSIVRKENYERYYALAKAENE